MLNLDPHTHLCADDCGHPRRLTVTMPTLRLIPDLRGLVTYLESLGTERPSLHPRAQPGTPTREVWNGWNRTDLGGLGADGRPITASLSHYATGWDHLSLGGSVGMLHGSVRTEAEAERAGVLFPLWVFPARSVILHPEHTPGHESEV